MRKTPIFLVGSGAKEVGGTLWLWLWLCGSVGLTVCGGGPMNRGHVIFYGLERVGSQMYLLGSPRLKPHRVCMGLGLQRAAQ